jgi:enoyl-[acyl-carrier protein] reductase II
MGAEAVQMGTRFVSAAESPVHANYKQAIVDAPTSGTYVLNKKASPCIRALKTERTHKIYEEGLMPPDTFSKILDLYFGGDMEAAVGLAGQSAGLIREVRPVKDIIDDMVVEFHTVANRMGQLGQSNSF